MAVKSPIIDLVDELRTDIASRKAVAALSAGATSGIGLLVAQIAFATFIFSGHLAPFTSQGVGLILFGNLVACLVIALTGGFRGVVAGLSPVLVMGMAVIAAEMEGRGTALFVSVSVSLIITAVLIGICCLAIGRFGLANLVRFIPYPVAAGFVAGIGGAVCLAAMSLMGAPLDWRSLTTLFEPATLLRWGPGVVYGLALYWAMKRWRSPLILPVSVVLAIGTYHLALQLLDVSSEEARQAGLLLTSTADGTLWPALSFGDLAHIDWVSIASQIPNMSALAVIALIVVVLNIAGLEVAANQELDWNREFKAGGLASLGAGLGGGTVASIIVPASLRSKLFGADTRLTGVVTAAIVAGALFLGDGMLEFVPTPLIGGVLVFAAMGMIDEGIVASFRRVPRLDFGVIALIFATIVAIGLLEGVGVGMLATLVFFVVRLSRIDPIDSHFTVREKRSKRVRPVPERVILVEEGHRVQVYFLRGYIFFGSVSPLTVRLRNSLRGDCRPHCLMLDFGAVTGLDFSALNVLSRLLETTSAADVQVVLSAAPQQFTRALRRNLPDSVFEVLIIEPNADLALERCEEVAIAAWMRQEQLGEQRRDALRERVAETLERHLSRQMLFEELIDELSEWLQPGMFGIGETLTGPTTPLGALQLLQSGRASACDAAGSRLFEMGPGDPVGLESFVGETVSYVIAEEPCRTLTMSATTRQWLETHRQALALKFYSYLLHGDVQSSSGDTSAGGD